MLGIVLKVFAPSRAEANGQVKRSRDLAPWSQETRPVWSCEDLHGYLRQFLTSSSHGPLNRSLCGWTALALCRHPFPNLLFWGGRTEPGCPSRMGAMGPGLHPSLPRVSWPTAGSPVLHSVSQSAREGTDFPTHFMGSKLQQNIPGGSGLLGVNDCRPQHGCPGALSAVCLQRRHLLEQSARMTRCGREGMAKHVLPDGHLVTPFPGGAEMVATQVLGDGSARPATNTPSGERGPLWLLAHPLSPRTP